MSIILTAVLVYLLVGILSVPMSLRNEGHGNVTGVSLLGKIVGWPITAYPAVTFWVCIVTPMSVYYTLKEWYQQLLSRIRTGAKS